MIMSENNFDTYWANIGFEGSGKKFDTKWKHIPDDADSILDVGGGVGGVYESMMRLGIKKRDYMVVDSSAKAIEIAEQNGAHGRVIDFDQGPMGFKDNSYDVVILSDVLEHVRNPWALLRESARIAKKYVYVHGPNFASWQCRLDLLRGRPIRQMVIDTHGGLITKDGIHASHIYFITYNNVIYWGKKVGLTPKTTQVFGYARLRKVRWLLEPWLNNLGEMYDIVFEKGYEEVEDDLNFKFYSS
jgi:ubiquinone/menaquinone biosynthesis C-methylase UbiE